MRFGETQSFSRLYLAIVLISAARKLKQRRATLPHLRLLLNRAATSQDKFCMQTRSIFPQTGLPARGSYSFERVGPRDFTFVSGLTFLPHCGCFGHMMLQLSPNALVSHFSRYVLCLRDFALVSRLSPLSSLSPHCCSGRVVLHLSPTCHPCLQYTLGKL